MEEISSLQIPKVKLGSQGFEVSRLGFGCGGLSGIYNAPLSHEAGCDVIKYAFSKGITFFNTSDLYGDDHHNEIMIGKALKLLPREKVQLATKFGITSSGDLQFTVRGTPEYVRQCCEASLKRLDLDYIDLYLQHRVDTSVPIEDTIEELKKLVQEGKIKYIGLSEASPDTIRRAHAVHPITAVEMEYSLWATDIEEDIIPVCRELGIGLVAYSPLGRGFFAGKGVVESLPTGSLLEIHPRFGGENLEKNKVIYNNLTELAAKHSCTPSQLALAWLLHQGDDIVPIPGTTKTKNLENNIGSLAVKLTGEDLKEVGEVVGIDKVAGEREYDMFSGFLYKLANTPVGEEEEAGSDGGGGSGGGATFGLPEEVLSVLPSDPFQQLDVARKITSIALSTRVSALESESASLRSQLLDRDNLIADLHSQIDSLAAELSSASDKLSLADQDKDSLLRGNAALSNTVRKLHRDVAKLEVFRKTLMQSLQEDDDSSARSSGGGGGGGAEGAQQIIAKPTPNDDDTVLPPLRSSSTASQYSETGNSYAEDRNSDASRPGVSMSMLLASQTSTPKLTPPGSPPSVSASGSPTRSSKPVSPRRSTMSFSTSRGMMDTASQTGRGRVDGKEFFRQVRSRLSYEQFGAFLANVKELNSHKQSKEETLRKAEEIFGPESKDLYIIFEGLISKK